jgi:phosphoenolpyruvate carboxylase
VLCYYTLFKTIPTCFAAQKHYHSRLAQVADLTKRHEAMRVELRALLQRLNTEAPIYEADGTTPLAPLYDELAALSNDPDEIQEEIEATEAKVIVIQLLSRVHTHLNCCVYVCVRLSGTCLYIPVVGVVGL